MNVDELLHQKWYYHGEGNANVAIALPQIQKILRIPKTEKPKTILGWIINWLKEILKWDYNKQIQDQKRNLDFYNCVMIPFFGNIFAQPAIEIRTTPSIIKKLAREILPFRPEYRTHKTLQVWSASLFADYTLLPKELIIDCLEGPILSVEIKPKQGWIPITERRQSKCLFCSNQFLKIKRGQIKEISLYCPLDLFSGDRKRILKALKALIHTPQNNLRIFKNGVYCFGENILPENLHSLLCEFFGHSSSYNDRLLDNFCFLLQQSVLKDFEAGEELTQGDYVDGAILEPVRENKCVFMQSELPEGCILQKILNIQKLNHLGLNKYKDIYNELENRNFKINNWGYIDKVLEQGQQLSYNHSTLSDINLAPYLLAAVAYDCSFMITLQKLSYMSATVNRRHLLSDGINNYLVNVGVFDLYPKPAHTVINHVKRDTKVLNAVLSISQTLPG